jgi:putative ABC transport system permease protein
MLKTFRRLIQRRRVARELDDELRFHVEMETDANVARGLTPDEARRRALAEFGGVVQTREAVGDVRRFSIESLWQDTRYSARVLGANPAFSLAAIGMLAVGIGVTTAMFTVVDALILRPVPFHAPEQLAHVWMGNDRGGRGTVAPAVLRAWRESPAFLGAESADVTTAVVEATGALTTRRIARVTPGIFELLGGVRPVAGRLFDSTEGRAGADDRVLLGEPAWRALFNGDPSIVGQRIRLDGEPVTVVGILPASFRFPAWDTALWRPIDFDSPPPALRAARATAYVRFAPDVPREDALRMATDAARAAHAENADLRPWVFPLAGFHFDVSAYPRHAVSLLTGGVLLVFLVLCANVCSLLLARVTARRREFSMRGALGASRGRLIRQALVESGVIGAAAVVVGVAVAWGLVSAARALLPDAFLLRTLNPLAIDLRALGVTSIAGVAATLGIGLLPAWLGTRVNAGDSLRISDRGGTEGRGARAVTRTLLVAEIALACALLAGATLLVRSFMNLTAADRGLDAAGVATLTMSLPETAFPDAGARRAAAQAIEDRLRQLPSVQQIAWSYGLPPSGGAISFGDWVSDLPDAPPVNMLIEHIWVGPEFFSLYRIPLLRGRTFEASDGRDAVIVGERLAAALWPGVDPVGRTFRRDKQQYQVIGVARETHYPTLDATADRPEFYQRHAGVGSYASLSLRCGSNCPDPAVLRRHVADVHPRVQVHEAGPLEAVYLEQQAVPRATAALGVAFAAVALLAAAGGLFSVLSYAVGRRRREFGIRAALGAAPAQLRRVVIRDGLAVALAGLTLGALLAALLSRGLAWLQYGVTPGDPLSLVTVAGTIGVTTLLAAWRPARAAARVDPARLLREE